MVKTVVTQRLACFPTYLSVESCFSNLHLSPKRKNHDLASLDRMDINEISKTTLMILDVVTMCTKQELQYFLDDYVENESRWKTILRTFSGFVHRAARAIF